MTWDVVIVGAGAAGLLAAIRAAERGKSTLLLEKNSRAGVKILMSGGTRCNLTHATDARGIVAAYGAPGKFLHSALAALSPSDLVELFHAEGVLTKVEDTGKVFPQSDKASDVLEALLGRLRRSGALLALAEPVGGVSRDSDGDFAIATPREIRRSKTVILTTGGMSYPGSGTTGDGYAWAASFGHAIVPPRPALTPVTVAAPWVRDLMGVTIPDVRVEVHLLATLSQAAGPTPKPLAVDRGSMLFAHFGLSGPVALNVSRAVTGHPRPHELALACDFAPAMSYDSLDERLRDEAASAGRRQIATLLGHGLPRRLSDSLLMLANLNPDCKAAELSKSDRGRWVRAIKRQIVPVSGAKGFQKAEVTAGGVSLAEVDSRTMQSKLTPGAYFAGEILDLDGPIGGYNFQAAFSTGWLAGSNV